MTTPVLLRQPYTGWLERQPVTSRRVPQEPRPPRVDWSEYTNRIDWSVLQDFAHELPRPFDRVARVWRRAFQIEKLAHITTKDVTFVAAVLASWWALTARPWVFPLAVALLWLAAIGYGLADLWLCRIGERPWRWTERRIQAATGALAVFGVACLVGGDLALLAAVSLLFAQAFAYRADGQERGILSHQRLLPALIRAEILKKDWDPMLRQFGRTVVEPEFGSTSVTILAVDRAKKEPLGVTAAAFKPKREKLEAIMGLRAGQLHIDHDDTMPAAAVTLTVTPPPTKAVVSAQMPDRWDYDHALPIGKDSRGKVVSRPTWGRHAAYVAMTGMGKTWFGRYDVGHALLDPRVSVYLLDFKDDVTDWRSMHPLCSGVVTGVSLSAGRRALTMLERIDEISESRKDSGGSAPGIVVVVDEWKRLILEMSRMEPQLAKDLDSKLIGLHATARSRRIKFISFWQAGTKDYISKAARINMGQRFCGRTEMSSEIRYFLEQVPEHLPKAPGQFIYKDEGQAPTLVVVPALDDAAFEAVCAQAARLRAGAFEAPVNPLEQAVHELLLAGPRKASEILKDLSEDIAPANAQRMGYLLRAMPGVEECKVGPKSEKAWKLVDGAPITLVSASKALGPGASDESAEEAA